MKKLASLFILSATALMITSCGWWNNDCCNQCCPRPYTCPCPRPCCCPEPCYCGDQPIDYCTPGYYQFFDPS